MRAGGLAGRAGRGGRRGEGAVPAAAGPQGNLPFRGDSHLPARFGRVRLRAEPAPVRAGGGQRPGSLMQRPVPVGSCPSLNLIADGVGCRQRGCPFDPRAARPGDSAGSAGRPEGSPEGRRWRPRRAALRPPLARPHSGPGPGQATSSQPAAVGTAFSGPPLHAPGGPARIKRPIAGTAPKMVLARGAAARRARSGPPMCDRGQVGARPAPGLWIRARAPGCRGETGPDPLPVAQARKDQRFCLPVGISGEGANRPSGFHSLTKSACGVPSQVFQLSSNSG